MTPLFDDDDPLGLPLQLHAMGVDVVADRVVWQGNHLSGAGVSAGIDMALALTERVHGRELAESLQLLGERPLQMAAQLNRQSAAARFSRARRALAGRRANRHRPAS